MEVTVIVLWSVTPLLCPGTRPRNAAATRTAILDAARERFAAESYDDVGMRDIARDVGVDAALISRYFGSKDDLFLAALDSCGDGSSLMQGEKSEFGARVANEIVFEPKTAEKLKGMSIMLRSIGSTKAAEMVQTTCSQRFFGPLEEWLSGPDATARARLLAGFIMGMSVSRELGGGSFNIEPAQCEKMRDRLAPILQALIDG
ncbi:TetR/AcrR family transcriptional regulator [Brevundimonas sp. SH203]|uniref:TetR/AcrR family transcriptional regulator n=1 Tax=Brevundimonas sp. SH203 TaxID=345167 RepID=UPI00135668DD|nr:TetR/AcrR family transcriptional regulator [Brevundimonas sp. SH203]